MLEIKDLVVNVGEKTILKNFNLTIEDNAIHCLMGPNGVGKSTICKTILKDPNYSIISGTITYNGEDITNLKTNEIANKGIMLIMQNPITIEGVTNAEMLRTALSEKTKEHIDIFKFNKELENICNKIDLPKSFIHRNINEGMSGGERKKNELLHLWMLKPNLVLIDEIDSGLDIDALKIVAKSLKEYQETYQASILIITHNPHILDILKPNYIHILKDQHIIQTGHEELLSDILTSGFNNLNKANSVGESDFNE